MIEAIDFSKFSNPTKEEDLLRNTWLCTGDVILFKGKLNVGKSLFAQQLMTAVATGKPWFGENIGKIKTYGVFFEDNETKLLHRQRVINEFYQLNMGSPMG